MNKEQLPQPDREICMPTIGQHIIVEWYRDAEAYYSGEREIGPKEPHYTLRFQEASSGLSVATVYRNPSFRGASIDQGHWRGDHPQFTLRDWQLSKSWLKQAFIDSEKNRLRQAKLFAQLMTGRLAIPVEQFTAEGIILR